MRYIGKKELFRFPLGPLMYWLGGIAVDRKAPAGLIDQVVDEFDRSPQILLGITPEGTRTPGARWKAGFYWIARRSGAAILPVYLDWGRKVIGIWPAFDPTESPRKTWPISLRNMHLSLDEMVHSSTPTAPCQTLAEPVSAL